MPTVAIAPAGKYRSLSRPPGRPWKVWDLDAELRYLPVVDALPVSSLPVCEVGSGIAGIAAWTNRPVIGIDPGDDRRHGTGHVPGNMRRLKGDGAHIPLSDRGACATLAVDTFEHIPRQARGAVIQEMIRTTADDGRVIIIGPTGQAARRNDSQVLARAKEIGADHIVVWLAEHFDYGLPEVQELLKLLDHPRVRRIELTPVFNARLHRIMHSAASGRPREPWPLHRVHHWMWGPFAFLARRIHRGACYRTMLVAELAGA